MQHIGDQRWWRWRLQEITQGAYTQNYLTTQAVDTPMASVDDDDADVVFTGSWTRNTNAASFEGAYHHSVTSGDTAVWTSPSGTTRLALRVVKAINGGVAKVALSGGATADLLPTAQELVDDGTLASSVLVANGGTLSPSDRVLDCYQGSTDYDFGVALADGLTPGAYTVTVTATGYKQSGASAARAYITGFSYSSPDVTPSTSGATFVQAKVLMTFSSAAEYAIYWKPPGGSYEWLGQVHGYDNQTAFSFTVDGAAVSLSDGDVVFGSRVVGTRTSELFHPDVGAGATKVGDSTVTYTLTDDGLQIDWTIEWLTTGTIGRMFPAMFPLDGPVFTAGSVDGAGENYDLTGNDDSSYGAIASYLGYVWESGGNWAAGMRLPDLVGVNNFVAAGPGTLFFIQDRAGVVNITKLYATRVYDPNTEETAAGTTMSSSALYRVAYLDDVGVLEQDGGRPDYSNSSGSVINGPRKSPRRGKAR